MNSSCLEDAQNRLRVANEKAKKLLSSVGITSTKEGRIEIEERIKGKENEKAIIEAMNEVEKASAEVSKWIRIVSEWKNDKEKQGGSITAEDLAELYRRHKRITVRMLKQRNKGNRGNGTRGSLTHY